MIYTEKGWLLGDPESDYKECVRLSHLYLHIGFGVYPAPDLYCRGSHESKELTQMTVYINKDDELHIDELSTNYVIKFPCKEDAKKLWIVFRYVNDFVRHSEVKLYRADIEKLAEACLQVINKRFGKEESK